METVKMNSNNESTESTTSMTDSEEAYTFYFPQVHPGHCLLLSSFPFCYGAYRTFHQPLDEVVRPVLQAHKVSARTIETAEEPIRRAVASVVAARALRVSSLASVGAFGIFGAMFFYTAGWNSVDEVIHRMQDWGHDRRLSLDKWLGVKDRVDRGHAEVAMMKGMSLDEEVEYISKTYMPDEDWTAEPEKKDA